MNPAPVHHSLPVAACPLTGGSHSSLFRSVTGLLLLLLLYLQGYTQADSSNTAANPAPASVADMVQPHLSSTVKKKRQWLVGSASIAGYGSSLILLNKAWYQNEPRTRFHTFDDSREWLQMDKAGHVWTAANTSRASAAMWRWAGLDDKKAAWLGGISGLVYLTGIEYLDAHSAKWGWSWSDVAANIAGASLFTSQELLWREQRIQIKFSFHPRRYSDPVLRERVNDLYGSSWPERMLKDYNAQTYWLSVNVASFFTDSKWPAWLNIAAGYGANGMFGGFENAWAMDDGSLITRYDIHRTREFYIAPDIDFTRIKTKSKFLRSAFTVLNAFKFPAPSLMLNSRGRLKFYPVYF